MLYFRSGNATLRSREGSSMSMLDVITSGNIARRKQKCVAFCLDFW